MNANASTTETLGQAAARLLAEGDVQVVIGYSRPDGAPSAGTAFVRKAEETERLVFDNQCLANLAVYLSKDEVRELGKAAVVVKGCDLRAVNVLLRESVIKRDDVVLIGVRCQQVVQTRTHAYARDRRDVPFLCRGIQL